VVTQLPPREASVLSLPAALPIFRLIPPGVAAGLLAGILLQFGIGAFGGMSIDPRLAGLLIVAYVVLKRLTTRYAVVGILVLGLRSEEHTSELQSRENLVCRLLLE